jgi:hypothetical protein
LSFWYWYCFGSSVVFLSVALLIWSCDARFASLLRSKSRVQQQHSDTGVKKDKRPSIQAKTQEQAIVHDSISYLYHNLSRPNLSGADIGPRYSLSTLTIGNTNVCFLIYRDLNHDGFLFDHYSISPLYHFLLKYNYNKLGEYKFYPITF